MQGRTQSSDTYMNQAKIITLSYCMLQMHPVLEIRGLILMDMDARTPIGQHRASMSVVLMMTVTMRRTPTTLTTKLRLILELMLMLMLA